MTDEQIDALMYDSISKQWTELHRLAWAAALQRADQETKDLIWAMVRGEIDVAKTISVPR